MACNALPRRYDIKSGMIVCMARYPKITLAPHLSAEELKERYRACDNPKEARRWHALWLFSAGKSIGEVSELVGFHRNWVRTFLKRYNEQGPDAVADQHQLHPGGREPYLTPEQQQELEQAIARPAPDGGLWTGPKVSAWIAERTGRRIYPQLGWAYLQKLGFVRREPRPQHQDVASAAEQAAWKKNERGSGGGASRAADGHG